MNFLGFLLFFNMIFDWHWDCSCAAWIRASHGKANFFSYSYSFRGLVFVLCRCAQELQSRTGHANGDLFQGFEGNHGRQDPQPIYELVSSIIILALCLWICGLAWCEGWGHTPWKYAMKIPNFRTHETSHKWACVCNILTCTFNVVCSSFQFAIGWSLEKVKVVMGVLDRGHPVHNEFFLQIPYWWEGDYEVCHWIL
jgi:hypothetical protein